MSLTIRAPSLLSCDLILNNRGFNSRSQQGRFQAECCVVVPPDIAARATLPLSRTVPNFRSFAAIVCSCMLVYPDAEGVSGCNNASMAALDHSDGRCSGPSVTLAASGASRLFKLTPRDENSESPGHDLDFGDGRGHRSPSVASLRKRLPEYATSVRS